MFGQSSFNPEVPYTLFVIVTEALSSPDGVDVFHDTLTTGGTFQYIEQSTVVRGKISIVHVIIELIAGNRALNVFHEERKHLHLVIDVFREYRGGYDDIACYQPYQITVLRNGRESGVVD
jgi:hypothetical protein